MYHKKSNIRSYKDDHFYFKFLVLFLLDVIELKKINDIQYVDFAEIAQIMFYRKYAEIKKMESATLYNSTLHVAYV